MKKKNLLLIISAAVILFFGCSKSNINSNSTTWAFNGTTYTAVNTDYYDSNSNLALLGGTDARGNYINIFFNSHPTSNGVFNLTRFDKLGYGNSKSDCAIIVGNNNSSYQYNSTGKSGETVSVTFNGGKIQATFNNITIEDAGDTTIVTGMIMLH
jgi:major membrane immunogen (membrane-anchored lipoprotein)